MPRHSRFFRRYANDTQKRSGQTVQNTVNAELKLVDVVPPCDFCRVAGPGVACVLGPVSRAVKADAEQAGDYCGGHLASHSHQCGVTADCGRDAECAEALKQDSGGEGLSESRCRIEPHAVLWSGRGGAAAVVEMLFEQVPECHGNDDRLVAEAEFHAVVGDGDVLGSQPGDPVCALGIEQGRVAPRPDRRQELFRRQGVGGREPIVCHLRRILRERVRC
jgi:hypothetical protein